MGFRSWLRSRAARLLGRRGRAGRGMPAGPAPEAELAPGCPVSEWDEVPAYLPVDPAEHREACVIAAAIAAGDRPESSLHVRSLSMVNPEYRRVAVVAAALAAGALEKSSLRVKGIYRKKVLEETHAA